MKRSFQPISLGSGRFWSSRGIIAGRKVQDCLPASGHASSARLRCTERMSFPENGRGDLSANCCRFLPLRMQGPSRQEGPDAGQGAVSSKGNDPCRSAQRFPPGFGFVREIPCPGETFFPGFLPQASSPVFNRRGRRVPSKGFSSVLETAWRA